MSDINFKWCSKEYREKSWEVYLYKGEGRIMVNPNQPHASGLRMHSKDFVILKDVDNAKIIGEAVLFLIKYFQVCPVLQERFNISWWKGATKYRSWKSFLENNDSVAVYDHKGTYHIASYKRITDYEEEDIANFTLKIMTLPYTATAEEIGQAVIDVLKASEEYHANMEKEKQIQEQEKK